MNNGLPNLEVVHPGCRVLALLATDKSVRKSLAVEGGVKILIQILSVHSTEPLVVTRACAALINTLFGEGSWLLVGDSNFYCRLQQRGIFEREWVQHTA
jgi:hypothetical protein